MLQPVAKAQLTYFKNSFELKQTLESRPVPPNASLFTYDAVSMYTNIDTDACIEVLTEYLIANEHKFTYNAGALIDAIIIVMRNNVCRFSDLVQRQIKGIAMGMPPAPPIATIFVGIQENWLVPKWKATVPYLERFIDDGNAMWLHDPDASTDDKAWEDFQADINSHHGLKWTFSKRCKEVIFMDLKISIESGKYETSLYEKPLALHLYLPPHSSHPPGVLTGLIMGQVLRFHQLCSHQKDIEQEIKSFFNHLLARGYHYSDLLPIFEKAVTNALITSTLLQGSANCNEPNVMKMQGAEFSSTYNFIQTIPHLGRSNKSGVTMWLFHQERHPSTRLKFKVELPFPLINLS